MRDFKLLKLPVNENHIQNRIDAFYKEIVPSMSPEQMDQCLDAVYDYMLKIAEAMEANEEDSSFAMNACTKIAECQYWIGQLYD